jgi:transposase-like protein
MVNNLSDYKVKKIISFCSEDIDATRSSKILGLSRKTVNRYFNMFREAILAFSTEEPDSQAVEFEVDESYFGARRVRGRRGRGAAGKTPVFGLLKRGDKVYVEVVPNCSREALMPIIQGQVLEGSTIHSDGWKAYDGLVLNGYDHYRVYHSQNEFSRGKSHVNGIETFWSYAKRRLAKFNGLSGHKFLLHLKECEFRFNHRHQNINLLIFQMYKAYRSKRI